MENDLKKGNNSNLKQQKESLKILNDQVKDVCKFSYFRNFCEFFFV